jgi:transcriptional coactivator HFI1/ADA1
MPDIDPAALALSRSGSISINPLVTTKSLATSTPSSQKQSKTHSIAARIDLEPLYTGLKGAVGEGWGIYKEAIGLFLLGRSLHLL